MYRPLPSFLTIKTSDIEGVGLFATAYIPAHTNLGISHYFWNEELIRTPLGGFYNHSDDPNCYTVVNNDYAELVTLYDIDAGEELTVTYTLNPLSTRSSVG